MTARRTSPRGPLSRQLALHQLVLRLLGIADIRPRAAPFGIMNSAQVNNAQRRLHALVHFLGTMIGLC